MIGANEISVSLADGGSVDASLDANVAHSCASVPRIDSGIRFALILHYAALADVNAAQARTLQVQACARPPFFVTAV
jgi:hypothetical protein